MTNATLIEYTPWTNKVFIPLDVIVKFNNVSNITAHGSITVRAKAWNKIDRTMLLSNYWAVTTWSARNLTIAWGGNPSTWVRTTGNYLFWEWETLQVSCYWFTADACDATIYLAGYEFDAEHPLYPMDPRLETTPTTTSSDTTPVVVMGQIGTSIIDGWVDSWLTIGTNGKCNYDLNTAWPPWVYNFSLVLRSGWLYDSIPLAISITKI